MENQDKKVRLKDFRVTTSEEIHEKYHKTCEKVFGNTRSGAIPIRQFMLNFINENNKPPKIK